MNIPRVNINPASYSPSVQYSPNISSFYANETMTLTFGEFTGRPSEFIDFHKSDLVYFISEGWKISSVSSRGQGGKWTVEARSVSKQIGSEKASGDSDSEEETSAGHSSSSGSGATANTQEGGPYWSAWSRVTLVRRKLQGDLVTDYIMDQLTRAYNEGRQLNSNRYDEICGIFAAMLNSTDVVVADSEIGANIDEGLDSIGSSLAARMRAYAIPPIEEIEDITARVDARVAQWLASRTEDINRQFDVRLEQAKSQMVANGTYNSVVWPSVSAGIERERQYALNNLSSALSELESSIAQIKTSAAEQKLRRLEAVRNIETSIADMQSKIKEAKSRVISNVVGNKLNLTKLRNDVITAMAAFMERREDGYPDIEDILNTVTRLDNTTVNSNMTSVSSGGGSHDITQLPNPTLPPLPS